MRRAIARFLLLAMLVVSFGPLALAASSPLPAAHCSRQPHQPAHLRCHEMAAAGETASSSGAVFESTRCCANHECCRPLVRSPWARFSAAIVRLGTELAMASPLEPDSSVYAASVLAYRSVRAPPAL